MIAVEFDIIIVGMETSCELSRALTKCSLALTRSLGQLWGSPLYCPAGSVGVRGER